MKKATTFTGNEPVAGSADILTEIVRCGARKMLAAALDDEVA